MIKKIALLLIPVLLIASTLACNLSGVGQADASIPDGLTENYQPSTNTVLKNPFSYSTEQQAVLQEHGSPTRFNIIFGELERMETWFYDTAGYTAVFEDGVLVAEKTFTPVFQEEMYATTYGPDQFSRGMEIDDIVLSTGRTSFVLSSVEGVGRLMHLEGLSIGLVDGQINFVETYPAATGPKLQLEDFNAAAGSAPEGPAVETGPASAEPAAEISLTPEETANAGLHGYSVIFYVNAVQADEETTSVEITFTESGLKWVENGETVSYTRLEDNVYQVQELDGSFLTLLFLPEGMFILYEEADSSVEIEFTRLD
ncbi:MAG: hypothetical protein JXA25_18750 [Anaerolineales bacterium]|nr:hypothetical protein [Anaerolineales bacterium]